MAGFNSLPVELKRVVLGHVKELFPCLLVCKELTYLAGPIMYSRLSPSSASTIHSTLPLRPWVGRRSARSHKVFSGLDCLVPTDDAPFGSELKAEFLKGVECLRVILVREGEREVGLGGMAGEGLSGVWVRAAAWELSVMADLLRSYHQDSALSPLRNLRSLRIHLQPRGPHPRPPQPQYSTWSSQATAAPWAHFVAYDPQNPSPPVPFYPPALAYPYHYPNGSQERRSISPPWLSLEDHQAIYDFAYACSPSHLLEWPLVFSPQTPRCSWRPMRGAPPREVVHIMHGRPGQVGYPVTVYGSRNVVKLNPVEEPGHGARPAAAGPYVLDARKSNHTTLFSGPVTGPSTYPLHFLPPFANHDLPVWDASGLADWVIQIVGHAHATPEMALELGCIYCVRLGGSGQGQAVEENTTWEFRTERMDERGYLVGDWEEEEEEVVREVVGAALGQLSEKVTLMLAVPKPDVGSKAETVATDGGSIFGEEDETGVTDAAMEGIIRQMSDGW